MRDAYTQFTYQYHINKNNLVAYITKAFKTVNIPIPKVYIQIRNFKSVNPNIYKLIKRTNSCKNLFHEAGSEDRREVFTYLILIHFLKSIEFPISKFFYF